jgi:hypothetical protein
MVSYTADMFMTLDGFGTAPSATGVRKDPS